MNDDLYEQLAIVLDRLPNGFPRTPARTEIKLLKWIFSSDEALLASQLTGTMEQIDVISNRVGLDPDELNQKLMKMAERKLIKYDSKAQKPKYRLAPFIVGIYEAQKDNMDHEFAHLFDKYMADGGAVGIMKPQPALHRVVPSHGTVRSEWILPYDDVKAVMQSSKAFRVQTCVCRVQQDLVGRRCDFPLRNCITFSATEFPTSSPDEVSKEEALSVLEQTEEIGLVHTVSNIMEGYGYVCNCCSCCCAILRGIIDWGIEESVAYANYYAVIDSEQCNGCGICIERCQMHAITEKDGITVVNREHCIGCGLCVSGCPSDVSELHRKPETEIVNPPADFNTWDQERLRNRGILK